MVKAFLHYSLILIFLYIIICGVLYFFQERLIFFPEKLSKDFTFRFDQGFEELKIKTADNFMLNGLLFRSNNPRGLIFYLHGNAGSLRLWGEVAQTYTDLNYDIFILDYRGFGKSEGEINSQEQVYQDVQIVYDKLKSLYDENKIIVLGYSIGTVLATKVASTNNPKLLILQAPFYSLTDMMKHAYPFIPAFLLKYKFETNKFIKECKMPIVIFHGNQDEVIYYNSSVKLKDHLKESDAFITLDRQGHNGMTANPDYLTAIENILTR
jgi:alpha-beta hydrolase superfamily lysophospholipase